MFRIQFIHLQHFQVVTSTLEMVIHINNIIMNMIKALPWDRLLVYGKDKSKNLEKKCITTFRSVNASYHQYAK